MRGLSKCVQEMYEFARAEPNGLQHPSARFVRIRCRTTRGVEFRSACQPGACDAARKSCMYGAMTALTHIGASGEARMVDVTAKPDTARTATAEGRVVMRAQTLALIIAGDMKKGDVLGAARIAGIMAAKRTHELIPLCHPLALTGGTVEIEPDEALPGLHVQATAQVKGATGVEMEALTAVSVACLTIYDMAKAVDRGMRIEGVRLVEKRGGKSGHWRAGDA